MEQNNRRKRLRGIIILLLLAVFLVSGAMTIRQYIKDKQAQDKYESLAEQVSETTQAPTTEEATEEQTEPVEEPYVSPIDFESLQKENPDTIGWIRVPDTNIDYPIVQGTDNDFYLKHDFDGNKSVAGTVYLDFESQGDFESRNNIIYGHNMKNGSMFKDVVRYKEKDYFLNHQYFSIYTPEREIKLKAVSCYYGEAKPIVRKTRFKTQDAFDAFVAEMIKPCSYAQQVAFPAKTLYTLVTCSYEINDARTFLFAVEVDEDGNEIGPDEAFAQKMEALMETEAPDAVKESTKAAVK